jgi:site-specific DNA recombinase
MMERRTALYARVSSEAQAPDNTIASQLASLRERLAADGFLLEPDACYFDEGYRRSVLLRPALERLTDAAAGGRIAGGYVDAPDRPARRGTIKDESGWSAPATLLCGVRRRLGHVGEGVRPG